MTEMTERDLDTYLGDSDATPEQRERMLQAAARANQHTTGTEQAAALNAAVQWILGETDAEDVGAELLHARVRLAAAMAGARQLAILAVEDGVPEARVARDLGVNRMTIRGWLGK